MTAERKLAPQRFARVVLLAAASVGCRTARPPTTTTTASLMTTPGLVAEGSLIFYGPPDSATSTDVADYRFALPVLIHGKTVWLAADHGSNVSALTDSAIGRLGAPHWNANATRADTLVRHDGRAPALDTSANVSITRGDSTFQYWGDFEPTVIDSLRVGTSFQDQMVFPTEVPAAFLAPFEGLLGRDILSAFDLEFNLPARKLRLYDRSSTASATGAPWLPGSMRKPDCVPSHVIRHTSMDTTHFDSTDMQQLRVNPAKRVWEQEELELPLVVNGRPVDALFDSGMGETIINWAEARALGIDRNNVGLRAIGSGSVAMLSFHHADGGSSDSLKSALNAEPNYRTSGVSLRLGTRTLPADSVVISDPTFADSPDFRTKPMVLVGLRHFRNLALFFSYSTAKVCTGER